MIQLTPRLAAIANEVNKGERFADIGTDHGFLPAALWERGISPYVILADVNEGPLCRARENCQASCPEHAFDFRLGNGLEVLGYGEVDTVAIAGMGGILISEILEKNLEKSWSFKKLILQPRSHAGRLRHWLYDHCFSITNEQLVREGRFICEIITAVPVEKASLLTLDGDSIEYQYPRRLLEFVTPLTEEYLENRLETEEKIYARMESGNQDWKILRNQKNRVLYLRDLLRDTRKALEKEK